MITFRDLIHGFETLSLRGVPVIAHASFKSLGAVQGGPRAVLDALITTTGALMMPAFTYETMVYPPLGPDRNGVDYKAEHARRAGATSLLPVYFRADLPVDREIGSLPELLRRRPEARRSLHPILSFVGVNAEQALAYQSMENPLGPIGALAERGGYVLLIGVSQRANTSVHYAEKLAGRPQFLRWAATPRRVVRCPNFPGDSFGFDELAPRLKPYTRAVAIGNARMEAIPLQAMFNVVQTMIEKNPLALLCQRTDCRRCKSVREMVGQTEETRSAAAGGTTRSAPQGFTQPGPTHR
ncbi:MAG: hypothetical protein HFACDABA_00095 [Anaerolineales bacterium]|nr:hypothetical protein [Anaerolineales bacterium]